MHKPRHTLFHRGYKYDAEGNLIELSDSKNGVSHFAYDPVERLREVLQPEKKAEQFVYDSTGNLLQRGERELRYDQPDRLTKMGDTTLVYDEAGNLVEKRRTGSTIRYSYDADNRLIAVESKEGGRIEFRYDPLGRRIAKSSKLGEVGFLWDGDVLLSEQDRLGEKEYIFSNETFEPLCYFDDGLKVYSTDHLGTPREILDEEGNLMWSARYDVHGRIDKLEVNKVDNPIRFQGQYEDCEIGLHYNFFRYYDPDTGRYITQDPIRLLGGINPYAYALNPLSWLDPLGLTGTVDGGRHRDTKIDGRLHDTESHHLIADAISDLHRQDAPAIRMEVKDHYRTGSHGHQGKAGEIFRAKQKALLDAGKYDEALKMGIDDVRQKFGTKYDDAIEQMKRSLPKNEDGSIDWSKVKRKGC
jgi:RHS repeat-associated protein